MAENQKVIKINELPDITNIEDSDILVIEDHNTTRKTSAQGIVEYIKNHNAISDYYVQQSTVDTANGLAALNANKKIKSENIPFGSTVNTVYEGSSGKALESSLDAHILDKDNPHGTTKQQIGLSNVDNTSDINKPVSTAQQDAIDLAYQNATGYADRVKSDIMGGIPESTLDTIVELGEALKDSEDALTALIETVGTKAPQTELDTHVNNGVIHITSTNKSNWTDAYNKRHEHSNKTVLDGVTTALITAWNNAVTHISDTVKHITAEERTDWNDASSKKHTHSNKPVLDGITSALVTAWNSAKTHAGSSHAPSNAERNVITGVQKNGTDVSPDPVTRKVDLSVPVTVSELENDAGYKTTDHNTTYSLVSPAKNAANGNVKIRLSGSDSTTKDILIKGTGAASVTTDPDGNVIVTSTDTNTTYGIATPASNGLMAASDKAKLDGVESGAQVNTVIGIKGNAETSYRTGQVNLTPADIGAAAGIHNHTRSQISDMPTKLSEFSNDSGYITADDVDTSQDHSHANKSILDSITQTLINTWGTVSNKVDKVNGKGLSTNDFTAAHLGKLNGIAAGANNYSLPAATSNVLGGVKTGPNITNSSGTISLTKSNVVSALGYTPGTSSADPITVDSELSPTSTNPVENKAVYAALEDKSHFSTAPTSGQVVIADGTAGAVKSSGYTIAASVPSGAKFTDTVYTHPTSAGNKHIPSGGSSGQVLRWSSAGTAAWGADNNSDTKNTAGSTNASSKLFLIGAASQAANPQTYSHDTAYVGEDGCLYSDSKRVSVDGHTHSYAGSGSAGGAATTALACTGNSATATKWAVPRNMNGLSMDGTSNLVNYASCSTAAGTAAKSVSCTGFALITGAEITVKFTVTNTAGSPTLNVNNTGAKPIYYRGSAVSAGYLSANRTYTFRYNGTQYDLVGDINVDTNNAVTQTITNTANANYRILFSNTADDSTRTEGTRKDTNLTYNPGTNTLNVVNVNGTASKAIRDANGNTIINEIVSDTEPANQKAGDFWLKEY